MQRGRKAHIVGHSIHENLFRQELAQLYPTIRAGNKLLIDPAWLVFLFGILWYVHPVIRYTACDDVSVALRAVTCLTRRTWTTHSIVSDQTP